MLAQNLLLLHYAGQALASQRHWRVFLGRVEDLKLGAHQLKSEHRYEPSAWDRLEVTFED